MGLFNWSNNSNQPTVVKRLGGFFGFFGSTSDEKVFTPIEAMEIAAVYSAVRLIAQAVAATPFNLLKIENKNNRNFKREIFDHPAYRLINDRPNPIQTKPEFLETIMLSALLGSGALIFKVKDGAGRIVELWPLPLDSWTQEVLSDGSTQFAVTLSNGRVGRYLADDVIFIHGASLDGYGGVSVIAAAKQALGIARSLGKTQKSFADSAGSPRGIITTDSEIPEDAKADLAEAVRAKFAAGQNGIMLLSGATTFTSLSENFNNSQFLQQREFITKEIAALFHVPSVYLSGGTITDADAKSFSQNAVRPWLIRIEASLNNNLLNIAEGYRFDADEHSHMRSDPIGQIDFLQKAMGAGGIPSIISTNEARVFLGYNPIDDDRYDVISLGGYAEAAGMNNPALAPKE